MIRHVSPGNIVFHYWTPTKAFVGASVAAGPLEDRPIAWAPRETVGRAKQEQRAPRRGWSLYGCQPADPALPLSALHNPADHA